MSVEERFLSKVLGTDRNGCHIWAANIEKAGYGILKVNNKPVKAHRVAYSLFKGVIPDGLKVLHKCDVRHCVNPDHLFLGTIRDNVYDMLKKKRHWQQKKEVCVRGHKFSETLFIDHRGKRQCGICQVVREKVKSENRKRRRLTNAT